MVSPLDITPGPFDNFKAFRNEKPSERKDRLATTLSESLAAPKRSPTASEDLEEIQSWSRKFNEPAPREDAESPGPTQIYDHGGPLSCDQKDLLYVFRKFIAAETLELEDGVTILVHDIPYGFRYRPEIVDMIESLSSIDSVDYIYLPMAVDRPKTNQFRNKGFCFIHFSDANMAQKFMNGISDYKAFERIGSNGCATDSTDETPNEFPHPKSLHAVFAKFQGMSTNLHNLIDIESKKWRPKNGFALVRTDSGLSNISLLALRVLAKRHVKEIKNQGMGVVRRKLSKVDDVDDGYGVVDGAGTDDDGDDEDGGC
jgi:hypothetical protein